MKPDEPTVRFVTANVPASASASVAFVTASAPTVRDRPPVTEKMPGPFTRKVPGPSSAPASVETFVASSNAAFFDSHVSPDPNVTASHSVFCLSSFFVTETVAVPAATTGHVTSVP